MQPPPDAVSEFRVVTNNQSAEYGRAAGATVNVAYRSGTNQIHGDAWEFFRDTALNAETYFKPVDGSKPPLRRNQYGGTLGGPLVQNKAFFFADFEGFRQDKKSTGRELAIGGRLKVVWSAIHPRFRAENVSFTNAALLSSLRAFSLQSAGGIFNTAGAQVTLSGGISGSGGLTKTGSGVLQLGSTNTYTGATVVSDGTLRSGASPCRASQASSAVKHRIGASQRARQSKVRSITVRTARRAGSSAASQ